MAEEKTGSAKRRLVYVGIRGSVVALQKDTGEIVWTTRLAKGQTFVPLIVEPERVFAVSGGEVSCLDPDTGAVLWHNALEGYGSGHAVLGGMPSGGISRVAEAMVTAAQAASVAGI